MPCKSVIADKEDQRAFVSLLGLLLSLVIIFFIGYKAYTVYLKEPSSYEQYLRISSEKNKGAHNQIGILYRTKENIQDMNQLIQNREEQYFKAVEQ